MSGSSDVSYESISAQEYSADDSRSSFDTQASFNYPPQTPSRSSNILPPNSETTEFDYLCQQATSDADTIPPEQAENYTGIDDETIVQNLRRTSGNLLSDALNMALEEASQFVMEQSNEVYSSSVGQDYNLVELAPWNNDGGDPSTNQGAFSEASAGYGTDPNTSLDDTMSVEYTQSDIKDQQVHTHGISTQPGMTSNVQYEISSATNLLYGSDQPCFEQDAYGSHGNHQFTNLQNRHQNMLGLLNSSTVNNLGPQNVQPINHWQNTSNSPSTNHQGNAARLGVNNLPLVPSVFQVTPQTLYGNGIPSSGGSRGSQQLEKSFLEEMASIDLMPPMQGCPAVAANAAGVQDCSITSSSTSNVVPNITALPNTDAFVSQSIAPNSNTFTNDIFQRWWCYIKRDLGTNQYRLHQQWW